MKTKTKEPFISVIVCTHSRENKISNCLNSLLNQAYNYYEIIVVNDKSTDNTKNVLSKFRSIKVVNNKANLGLAFSRNIGVNNAKGDILAFTDDDCVADKNWLKNLSSTYTDPKIDGVGGKIVPYQTDAWLFKYYSFNNPLAHSSFNLNKSSGIFYRFLQYLKRNLSLNQLSSNDKRLYSIVGANMSMRKTTYKLVNGFNNNIRFGGEEMDFWNRLRTIKPNYKLLYAPDAVVKHDYDSSFKDAFRRNLAYGNGQARQYLSQKNIIPVIYPFPLLILLSLLLALISPYFIFLSGLLVIIFYPGWINVSLKKQKIFLLSFSYVQFVLEMTLTVGFIYGYIKRL